MWPIAASTLSLKATDYLQPLNAKCAYPRDQLLCGEGYNGCGNCVIQFFDKNKYDSCIKQSPFEFNVPTGRVMHAPTCNIFWNTGEYDHQCENKETECAWQQTGERTDWDEYGFYSPLSLNEETKRVCPGDQPCDGCINQRSGNSDGEYTFEGMTILLDLNHHKVDWGTGCLAWYHDISKRCVYTAGETPCSWIS